MLKHTFKLIHLTVITIIILLSSCNTNENKVEFEFYTSNISLCRKVIYDLQANLQYSIKSDKKSKISKRIRHNEITLQIPPQNIDSLISAIEKESTVSCKKVLYQSDLSTEMQQAKSIELQLLIVYSK
ncbi:MAG: hypothetical protein RLZZ175_277 [Bacteroidota bacterium]|jgi:hypothetical protein